jgi:hypothetical protein
MNRIEKLVYDRVKHNAALKIRIRNIYQSILDLVPQKSLNTNEDISVREGFFFGFHDKSPFSSCNKFLLANREADCLRAPRRGEKLSIGYFEGPNWENFVEVSQTAAWNWHQGCMLQWVGNDRTLIFNDVENEQLRAKTINIDSGYIRSYRDPIGAVSPNGSYFVGYDFKRVETYMNGYGYDIGDSLELKERVPSKSFLYLIKNDTGERINLISLASIVEQDSLEDRQDYYHWFSHVVISPDSKRILFMHRRVKDIKSQVTRWSSLYSIDTNGENLHRFPCRDMVSHIGWRNKNEVIAYCRIPGHGDGYYIMSDNVEADFKKIGQDHFNSDGHPSFESSGRFMITDTYPDRFRQQSLIAFDLNKNRKFKLGEFYHHKKFTSSLGNHIACDLHPRWDRTGSFICFDSVFTGRRSLVTMKFRPTENFTEI